MSQSLPYKGDVTLSLHVSDLEASIAWYRDVLGFTELFKMDDHKWCEMVSPVKDVTVGLGEAEKVNPKGGCVPVWGVTDIDAARGALEANKVKFDGDTVEIPGMVKLATFFDPDGNAWMLAQSLMSH